ncbi:MAG: FkbM family methyltransferase [Planctomycetota bacterium]
MRPTIRALFSVAQLPGALRLARPWHGIWPDGSVVRIRAGLARGLAWRRHHRYGPSLWMGTHQPHVQNALARLLEPGMRVFDISAHAGFFSVAAGRLVGPTGHVLAVEPHPEHVASIRAQAALNNDLPIDVVACRVGERAGLGTMLFLRHGLPIGDAPFLGRDVEVRTVDGLVREHGRPHVVRLDVEGAECDVLRGAAYTLAAVRPTWIVATHGKRHARAVFDVLHGTAHVVQHLDGSLCPRGDVRSAEHLVAVPAERFHP